MLVRYFIRSTNANLRIELPRHAISIVRFLLSYLDVASPVKSNVSDRKARLFIVIYLYNSLVSWRGFVFPRFVFYCCGIEGLVPGPLTFESLSLSDAPFPYLLCDILILFLSCRFFCRSVIGSHSDVPWKPFVLISNSIFLTSWRIWPFFPTTFSRSHLSSHLVGLFDMQDHSPTHMRK